MCKALKKWIVLDLKRFVSAVMTMVAMAVLMASSILPHHHHGDVIYWFPDDCPFCEMECAEHHDVCGDCSEPHSGDDHDSGRCVGVSPYLAATHDTRDETRYCELPQVSDFTLDSEYSLIQQLPEPITRHVIVFDDCRRELVFVRGRGLRAPPALV